MSDESNSEPDRDRGDLDRDHRDLSHDGGDPNYDDWIENRRSTKPSPELTDRVMAAIESETQQDRVVVLAGPDNLSGLVSYLACLSAFLIGCLPFLYAAYAAKLLQF